MYKSDVATNIRSSDREVLGKNDVFFDRSSVQKGYSCGRLFFSQIRTGSFSKECKCCSARNKFRTGALPRILNYSTEHSHLTGNYKNLSFSSLKIKNAMIFQQKQMGCSGFFFSIKIQNTSAYQTKKNIFNRTLNFDCLPLLSTEQLFFLPGVLSGTYILRQKHTSGHLFPQNINRTYPSG